jgi:ABC-type sugar transport system ATPase subunit
MEPILRGRNLSKRFGKVLALDDVSIELFPDEVVGLIGDNGAGKTTLIKLLAGALPPDVGRISYFGEARTSSSPGEVRDLGIETIYQEQALVGNLDVEGNIFLGREPVRPLLGGAVPVLDREYMRREAVRVLNRLGIHIELAGQKVATLSGGQQQAVAIARAVYWGAKIILMDEPTTYLGVREKYNVLSLIRTLRERGTPMIIASHELPDILAVADRIVVLRLGKKVAERRAVETDQQELVSLMMGWG